MANRRGPRSYTPEQRVALVSEIDRRYRAGEGPVRDIAKALGTTDSNYYNWVRAGLLARAPEPAVPPPPPPSVRYDAVRRKEIGEEIERLRAGGLGIDAACKAVGIADTTYRRWRRPERRGGMRPVEVTALVPVADVALALVPPRPTPAGEVLRLVTPEGYRLEGLTVETAAALLRALS